MDDQFKRKRHLRDVNIIDLNQNQTKCAIIQAHDRKYAVLGLILECGETAHCVRKDNPVLWDTIGRGNPTDGLSVQTSIWIVVSKVKTGCEQGRGPDL